MFVPPQVLRSIRVWAPRLAAPLAELEQGKAQLGLAHSYSRAKVKFNVNRVDNMIIQARAAAAPVAAIVLVEQDLSGTSWSSKLAASKPCQLLTPLASVSIDAMEAATLDLAGSRV